MEDVPRDGESPRLKGSIMLALAASKQEVVDALKSDPYFKSDVWDWEKVSAWVHGRGMEWRMLIVME
jgi:hypothetical protein